MTILVCQDCDTTVDFMHDEKVSTLYVKCNCCQENSQKQA
ncbi:GapA-binding peptide SR1P [Ammoniphilus sp. CFH 90114]|nr:GapA-binding peptide SR1P [Ammoniphilus sp. CFH 90114]RXT15358.1 GapA-binding peptide SR1P [Ammoniphilus sp. CFH 90114]